MNPIVLVFTSCQWTTSSGTNLAGRAM